MLAMVTCGSLLLFIVAFNGAVTLISAVLEASAQPGLLIENKPDTWYSFKVSNPVVLQLGPQDYRMWAYGREAGYQGSPAVSFGRTGYFTSKDGVQWTPVKGPSAYGSVMSGNSSCGLECFDSGDIGVTDVIASPREGVFYQWYMGMRHTPNNDTPAFGAIPATRGGVAVSYDGMNWVTCRGPKSYGGWLEATPGIDGFMFMMTLHRLGPSSTVEWKENANTVWRSGKQTTDVSSGASQQPTGSPPVPDCSKLIRESQSASTCSHGSTPCLHVAADRYHTFYNSIAPVNGSTTNTVPFNQLHIQLFGAVGANIFEFNKTGPVQSLAPNVTHPLAMDSLSTGSARVLALPRGGYLLFYEAMNATSIRYSIGLARSQDGIKWVKDTSCTGLPGGPVLRPGDSDSSWDWYTLLPKRT
eukprot:GHUV01019558.1.p1 GENE.GHUV01019558.1~~GHUV01019558.1.p1  ORF type:complete len:414 (+),score=54.32 GHUV01019558.1:1205-2446(+)